MRRRTLAFDAASNHPALALSPRPSTTVAAKNMGISFEPKSTLGFILAVSLVAVLLGAASGNGKLLGAAWPILAISGLVWLIFVGLAIRRNF